MDLSHLTFGVGLMDFDANARKPLKFIKKSGGLILGLTKPSLKFCSSIFFPSKGTTKTTKISCPCPVPFSPKMCLHLACAFGSHPFTPVCDNFMPL